MTEGVFLPDGTFLALPKLASEPFLKLWEQEVPEPGDGDLLAGPSRNSQVFDPLDFLAEVTQHTPDPGAHLAVRS